MSFETERATIFKYISDNWDVNTRGVIGWPNQKFDQPKGSLFIIVTLMTLASAQMSMGGVQNIFRHEGSLQIDIYLPQNQGVGLARTTADYLTGLFRQKVLFTSDGNKLQFRTPTIRELAINAERALNMDDIKYRLVVHFPFYRDEYL